MDRQSTQYIDDQMDRLWGMLDSLKTELTADILHTLQEMEVYSELLGDLRKIAQKHSPAYIHLDMYEVGSLKEVLSRLVTIQESYQAIKEALSGPPFSPPERE